MWQESVRLAKKETFEQFVARYWRPWLAGKTPWEHWTCGADFEQVELSQLEQRWPEICEWAGIKEVPLMDGDWQLEKARRASR
jgi:hypothetical protein